MASNGSEKSVNVVPARSYMDDPDIKWRYGMKPSYSSVDNMYQEEKTNRHAADSIEKLVENIVKTWEMEASHKPNVKVLLGVM